MNQLAALSLHNSKERAWSWLRNANLEQRRALLAASLGWMLDSMDVMLYALLVSHIRADLSLSAADAGFIMSATLVCAAVGGIAFGWIADRFGRTRALTYSILVYCVCTTACGIVHTRTELLIFRMFLGFGMGGEWAAGAALVAETWPGKHRARALALVQSSWAIGYGLGAAVVAIVLPRFGWRPVFFAGLLPAIVTIWIRSRLREPEVWEKSVGTGSITQLLHGVMAWHLFIITITNAATLFAWWGLFFWVPSYLSMPISKGGRGLDVVQTSIWTIFMQVGTFLGYNCYGWLADRLGRKWVYVGYLFMAAIVVVLYARATSSLALLLLGPVIGFWGSGYFSGFAVIASELFPTTVRGTAMGLSYNIGRVVSAMAPMLVGRSSDLHGMDFALSLTALSFAAAAVMAILIPETRGRALD